MRPGLTLLETGNIQSKTLERTQKYGFGVIREKYLAWKFLGYNTLTIRLTATDSSLMEVNVKSMQTQTSKGYQIPRHIRGRSQEWKR